MLTLLVPLLAALAAPAPLTAESPSPPVPPSPLKEIGRVQSLSVCSAVVVHANSAIGEALDNDAQLALAINRLRTTDLDSTNEITRRNGMNDLSTLAGRIRTGAAAGTGEVKRLREIVATTSDPTRKAELKAFADALGGALARQRKAGVDLDRMLVIIDGRRAVEDVNTTEMVDERASIAAPSVGSRQAIGANPGLMRSAVAAPGPGHEPVDGYLHDAADDFTARTQVILSDEGIAADHALAATTGC